MPRFSASACTGDPGSSSSEMSSTVRRARAAFVVSARGAPNIKVSRRMIPTVRVAEPQGASIVLGTLEGIDSDLTTLTLPLIRAIFFLEVSEAG